MAQSSSTSSAYTDLSGTEIFNVPGASGSSLPWILLAAAALLIVWLLFKRKR